MRGPHGYATYYHASMRALQAYAISDEHHHAAPAQLQAPCSYPCPMQVDAALASHLDRLLCALEDAAIQVEFRSDCVELSATSELFKSGQAGKEGAAVFEPTPNAAKKTWQSTLWGDAVADHEDVLHQYRVWLRTQPVTVPWPHRLVLLVLWHFLIGMRIQPVCSRFCALLHAVILKCCAG